MLLLHGFPYDINSFVEVAPMLAARGCRVIVPHLRGHGSTTFLDKSTPRAGLTANRADIARIMWANNSPTWKFDDATFARSAANFNNPDYVDVVIHSYRHRLGTAPGYPQYAALERHLAALPVINVPTITIDGEADGVVVATDGKSTAARFGSNRRHRTMPNVGHNPPQEAPQAFADAVMELVTAAR